MGIDSMEIGIEVNTTQDELLADFFSLVAEGKKEVVIVENEGNITTTPAPSYFAETMQWLKSSEVDPISIKHLTMLQSQVEMQQFLCICSQHNAGENSIFTNNGQGAAFDPGYQYSMQKTVEEEKSHAEHSHCKCGGHYKEDKCEQCGKKKKSES
jgi:hypothetical protein